VRLSHLINVTHAYINSNTVTLNLNSDQGPLSGGGQMFMDGSRSWCMRTHAAVVCSAVIYACGVASRPIIATHSAGTDQLASITGSCPPASRRNTSASVRSDVCVRRSHTDTQYHAAVTRRRILFRVEIKNRLKTDAK